MAILTGKDGTLDADGRPVTPVTNWRLTKTSANKAYTANDTGAWRRRVGGAKDCAGRFELKASDTGCVPVEEGQAVTLRLHVDDSGNNYYEVPARIDAIRAAVEISGGKPISLIVAFSGNGAVVAHGILARESGS